MSEAQLQERLVILEGRLALLEQALPPPASPVKSKRATKSAGVIEEAAAAPAPVTRSAARESKGNAVSIADLVALDGETFVRAAYRLILRKETDRPGLQYYLYELGNGVAKEALLQRLAREPEALQYGVSLV